VFFPADRSTRGPATLLEGRGPSRGYVFCAVGSEVSKTETELNDLTRIEDTTLQRPGCPAVGARGCGFAAG